MVMAILDIPCYLIEWYRPELTAQSIDDIVDKLNAVATTVTSEGRTVRLLLTLSVPTDEVLYGLFAAFSSETVVDACQRAAIPPQRLSADVGARIMQPVP
jgi:hypothetical protein